MKKAAAGLLIVKSPLEAAGAATLLVALLLIVMIKRQWPANAGDRCRALTPLSWGIIIRRALPWTKNPDVLF